jgi:predicted sulfurtransferase
MAAGWDVLLYFKYVVVAPEKVEELSQSQHELCTRLGLKGRIRIGVEGINGSCGGSADACTQYIDKMEAGVLFSGIDWKRSQSDIEPFAELVVRSCGEIVSSGGKFAGLDVKTGAKHLCPVDFHAQVEAMHSKGIASDGPGNESDAVLIDVRNRYETCIGRFENSTDPDTKTFIEFADWVDQNAEELRSKKQVLMYCTGGIRCEKASAYLVKHGVNDVSVLEGGIHRYLEQYPDGGHFKGKNFVFDARISMASQSTEIVGRCSCCKEPFDQIRRDRLCSVCNDLVIVCDGCVQRSRGDCYCVDHVWLQGKYCLHLNRWSEQELLQQKSELEELMAGEDHTRHKGR